MGLTSCAATTAAPIKALFLLASMLLGGCAATRQQAVATSEPPPLPIVLALPDYPLSPQARPTTSAEVYRANLESRIHTLVERPDADSPSVLAMRATAHFERYQSYGDLSELTLARELAARASRSGPQVLDAQLIEAHVAAYLHEFEAARTALARAQSLDPRAEEISVIAAGIARAEGRVRQDSESAAGASDPYARVLASAQDCVEMGDLDCASRGFHEAQFLTLDTSPVTLAWLHTQQGIALLRFGHPQAAIPFFRAALARLPDYFVAAEHLAECLGLTGNFAESRSVYERVIEQTGHPEFMAGLAGMLVSAGEPAEAGRWRKRAQDGYARLLRQYPATYAHHAVGFYLEIGESATAFKLARNNLRIRQDVSSWLLLAEAAVAVHECSTAAEALTNADETGWRPPERAAIANQVGNCRS